MKMVNTFNDAMRRRFGRKVYRLSLDGGMTCPNRDGTVGSRGCIFCDGSGFFAAPQTGGIAAQFQDARLRVAAKAPDAGYVAYFQSYTNTYAPLSVLERLYTEAIEQPGVLALSVATRPDCLPDETLSLLEHLSRRVPVWVELGLQTVHERTAAYIRRGYPLFVYEDAVQRLKARGIEVITHMILGLPGETDVMIAETAAYIGRSGSDGVKFHLLHVLSGTDLVRITPKAFLRR
jgi:radical SAM protein (TIGR01212 family)